MLKFDKNDLATLVIDVEELAFKNLRPEIETAMNIVLADHAINAQHHKAPDGSEQKKNSEPYKTIKRTKGIKVGSRRLRGTVPTILSGDMMGSRQIKGTDTEVTAFYSGAAEVEKARKLKDKGYKIHFLSKKNIDLIQKMAIEAIKLDKLLKIKK